MPQTIQKYYKHIMMILVLLGAIAGSIPLWQWIDSKVVFAADLEPIQKDMTRGFQAITDALRANSVNDMSTRISVLEMDLRRRNRDLIRNLAEQEELRKNSQLIPEFFAREQSALEAEMDSIRANLAASRQTQTELIKVGRD